MPTIAEQYIEQGFKQGYKIGFKYGYRRGLEISILMKALQDIEFILELKFGETGVQEFEIIKKITDIKIINQTKAALKTIQTIDELRVYYPDLISKNKNDTTD